MALTRGPDKGQGYNPFIGLLSPSLAYPHHGDSVRISPLDGGGEALPTKLQFTVKGGLAWTPGAGEPKGL